MAADSVLIIPARAIQAWSSSSFSHRTGSAASLSSAGSVCRPTLCSSAGALRVRFTARFLAMSGFYARGNYDQDVRGAGDDQG